MIRFLSKRYSKKRKNKNGLKISNPILMQDGEANYPAALLNLSSTIPVQRPNENEPLGLNDREGNLRCHPERGASGSERGSRILISSVNSGQPYPMGFEKHSHLNAGPLKTATENTNVIQSSENINGFEKSASRTELRACADANLHVFHSVRPPRNVIQCRVEMLDGAFYHVQLPKSSNGQQLLERVFTHMDILERDYFGLKYLDANSVSQWLDPRKPIKKQSKDKGSGFHQFVFRVKFYSSEPSINLQEEITRYQFVLQLKHDILKGILPASYETIIELSAQSLQAELGDFQPDVHDPDLVSEFMLYPNQDERMEADIFERFKELRHQKSPYVEQLGYEYSECLYIPKLDYLCTKPSEHDSCVPTFD